MLSASSLAKSLSMKNGPRLSSLVMAKTPIGSSLVSHTTRKALFSSECAPAMKLRCIFEEYRQEHFSRELPSRFRKEIVKVLTGGPDQKIAVDNFNIVLTNIGRAEACLSETELNDLLAAAGVANVNSSRNISVEQAMQLL